MIFWGRILEFVETFLIVFKVWTEISPIFLCKLLILGEKVFEFVEILVND